MANPVLKINKNDMSNPMQTLGMTEILKTLINSNLFDIEYHTETIKAVKSFRGTILYLNDKKIFLDFWEYTNPTYSTSVLNGNFDLIIKLQHQNRSVSSILDAFKRKNFFRNIDDKILSDFVSKIIPWTFFPSRIIKNALENNPASLDIGIENKSIGFFCGKNWRGRKKILKYLVENGVNVINSSQERRDARPLSDTQYINMMKQSKYGIVIAGRCSFLTEPKNRREIDYMVLKKPLLLNYKPTYYNPLIEGKHYIYLDQTVKMSDLLKKYTDEDLKNIVNSATEWYNNNASTEGIIKSFCQIAKEKLNITI